MTLADYTNAGLILPQLQERDKPGAIKELSRRLQAAGCIRDVLPFYNEVLNREFLVNTAFAHALAFPHARMGDVKRLCFALGRSPEPIEWGPRGMFPVRLIFLLAVPVVEAASYLYLISGLAKVAREGDLLGRLLEAGTPEEIIQLLAGIALRTRPTIGTGLRAQT